MMTKLFLKPHHLPLLSVYPKFLFLEKPFLSTFSIFPLSTIATTSSSCTSQSQFPDPSLLSYGPSLHKGTKPSQFPVIKNPEHDDDDGFLDEQSFTRVFDIAALRVPSKDCFSLESKLRGHLLNWPRIRNIARVPGDDVDPEVVQLLGRQDNSDGDGEEGSLVSLHRRIYGKAEGDGDVLSPVLYRDKLAKTFNSRGFVKFRNLAKISRPKKKKKKTEEENFEGNKRIQKNGFAIVEVLEDQDGESEELKNLLGEDFKRNKWRGSTRLLLLDECYAGKGLEELPEAIKVAVPFQHFDLLFCHSRGKEVGEGGGEEDNSLAVFTEYAKQSTTLTIELVRCNLTLFYDYWQMNEILEALLPKGMIVPSAFETVGHIAHLNLRDEHLPYKKLIAKVVLDKTKPKIQTVVNKIDSIHNEYRTMQLEVLAGNHSLVTTVVENGIRFQVDLATVYWNSRLATERQRLLSGFTRNDVVCDVFSGVGPLAISAAKIVKRVFANDLNPCAVEYLERNCVLNKLERKIEVWLLVD
ncbi:tRNA (guanine(37)-N1)-methyltransferase 1 [Senna tora]|uniref:tRNA (Guanine(37)-N1)-methyltransferase 1 n=1 Tax=Senna tora TaxID=362788 RepID=A0A834WGQ9_9FABA|nr:tRNA (guanine(37)-N1)-methyltransferase 1 [Senna tora]